MTTLDLAALAGAAVVVVMAGAGLLAVALCPDPRDRVRITVTPLPARRTTRIRCAGDGRPPEISSTSERLGETHD